MTEFDVGYLAAAFTAAYGILITYDLWLDIRFEKQPRMTTKTSQIENEKQTKS